MLAGGFAGLSGSLWALILILGFVLIWGWVVGLRTAAWKVSRRAARARKLGEAGERRGLRLLRRAGYRILERQPSGRARVRVDEQVQGFRVRADALVTRDEMVFVVEFKGGEQVSSLKHRHTRRQLLEYSLAFDVDGVLLVDAYDGEILTVEFLCADGLPVASRARDHGFDESLDEADESLDDYDESLDDYDDEDVEPEPDERGPRRRAS